MIYSLLLRERIFILAQSFRSFCSWSVCSVSEGLWSGRRSWWEKRVEEQSSSLRKQKDKGKLMEIPPVSDLRPPAGPPTKERQPLNNATKPTGEIWALVTKSLLQTPSASNQAFNTFREMFQIKTIGKARKQHNCVLHHLSMRKQMLCGQLVRVFQN